MKAILCTVALLALTVTAADAKTRHHHRTLVMSATTAAVAAGPAIVEYTTPGACQFDCANYQKNLRESGWNPRNDFDKDGNMKTNNY